MHTTRLPRRSVLKLGAVLVGLGLLGVGSQSAGAQTPAPVQVPRAPAPPASAAPPMTSAPPAAAVPSPVPAAPPDAPVGNWLWQRTELRDGTTVTVADPIRYALGLRTDGRFTLIADCNQGFGTYSVSGSQLALQPGPMTLIACAPGSQDTEFLRDLRRVATFAHDGENLVLALEMDGGKMVFAPEPPLALTGLPWRVVSVNNGRGGVVTAVPGTQLTIVFDPDGTVSGDTGCNIFRGPYTLTGETIQFGNLIVTRRACLSDESNAQEQAFLAALTASTRVEHAAGRVTLRNDAGATQLVLARGQA